MLRPLYIVPVFRLLTKSLLAHNALSQLCVSLAPGLTIKLSD